MTNAYFICSDNVEEDRILLKDFEDWIPTEENIKPAKIHNKKLTTLDGIVISNVPKFLIEKEMPLYLTQEVLNYLMDKPNYPRLLRFQAEKN